MVFPLRLLSGNGLLFPFYWLSTYFASLQFVPSDSVFSALHSQSCFEHVAQKWCWAFQQLLAFYSSNRGTRSKISSLDWPRMTSRFDDIFRNHCFLEWESRISKIDFKSSHIDNQAFLIILVLPVFSWNQDELDQWDSTVDNRSIHLVELEKVDFTNGESAVASRYTNHHLLSEAWTNDELIIWREKGREQQHAKRRVSQIMQ